ncbi:DMT family transporter [Buchnera aphidicola (Neophyllaphis podocarpi)]|uniref:DMT family transporter n=1 Tax=Buchnera aphidicola TaxID=9 RepID=UPI0031B88AD3
MQKFILFSLFVLVSFTWGTTWLAMKIVLETIPPIFATGLRFLLTSPLLILIALFTKKDLFFPEGKRFFQFIISVFYFAVPFTLMLYGGHYLNSGISSIIFANMPVFVLILSSYILKKKFYLLQNIGSLISISSLIYLLIENIYTLNFLKIKGILALVLAMIIHAVVYTQCKKQLLNVSVITFNALPSFFSGIILTIISFFVENPKINNFSLISFTAVIYLSIFAGIFGILSYFYLQKNVSVFHASIVFLIFPFISIGLESYFYNYNISNQELIIMMFTLLGILLTLIPKQYFKKFNYLN